MNSMIAVSQDTLSMTFSFKRLCCAINFRLLQTLVLDGHHNSVNRLRNAGDNWEQNSKYTISNTQMSVKHYKCTSLFP